MKDKYLANNCMGGGILRTIISLNSFSCVLKWIE